MHRNTQLNSFTAAPAYQRRGLLRKRPEGNGACVISVTAKVGLFPSGC